MWTVLKFIGALAFCYVAIALFVYFSQRRLLYFPRSELVASPVDIGLIHEEVWLQNGLGTRVHGWWLPHEQPGLTLLFCHGNGGNISHRLESLRLFHSLGLSVLIFDYSGYGQSEGEPSEKATRADAMAAWEWLVQERGIDPSTIVIFGRSLGGGVAASLARDLVDAGVHPAAVVMESTFTSVPDMGAEIYPWLPVRWLAKYRYDSRTALKGLRMPLLSVHSPDDQIVPYRLGRALYDSYDGPKAFLEIVGDHDTGYLMAGQRYVDGFTRFLAGLETPR